MNYQDAIAWFGVGSAHPGGFQTTMLWMNQVNFTSQERVLEVGCGTGRTACLIAERFGCHVLGVDIRPKMIFRAEKRADAMGSTARFKRVRSGQLPFSDVEFDTIIVESVTVFNAIQSQLAEYFRLLKVGGRVIDTEMCAAAVFPDEVAETFSDFYGAFTVPTIKRWKTLYQNAGFDPVHILFSAGVQPNLLQSEVPDPFMEPEQDGDAQEMFRIAQENDRIMQDYAKWLQYAVILAEKP